MSGEQRVVPVVIFLNTYLKIKLHFLLFTGQEFVKHGFLHRMFLVLWYCALQRQKYYFAWKLGKFLLNSTWSCVYLT